MEILFTSKKNKRINELNERHQDSLNKWKEKCKVIEIKNMKSEELYVENLQKIN